MWVTGAKLMSGWFMAGDTFTFTKEGSILAQKSVAEAYDFYRVPFATLDRVSRLGWGWGDLYTTVLDMLSCV